MCANACKCTHLQCKCVRKAFHAWEILWYVTLLYTAKGSPQWFTVDEDAPTIAAAAMEAMALAAFDIDDAQIKNCKRSRRDDIDMFNYDMLSI